MPNPNIIIYLSASLDTLLNRIQLRGRKIEKNISPLYLEQLSLDYEKAMSAFEQEHPDIPVLRFDGDTLDFVQNKHDFDFIINSLSNQLLQRSMQL